MTSESPSRLRLHVEELAQEPALVEPRIEGLLSAFQQATGWQLELDQSPPGLGEVWSSTIDGCGRNAGRLVLRQPSDQHHSGELAELATARPLALAISNMLSENNRLRHALWQREAELAAGVPVAARAGDEAHLAERLTSVLKSGAEAIGCQAAGLYLLDDATSELKLRAAFGLPEERFLVPPRPLRGAVADLEALVGHAVVLEDTSLLPHWKCPEDFSAAVCVPVSSPSIPLGTLWAFCQENRDFSPEQTNLLEIVAGRLAADLEREMLLTAETAAKHRDKQFERAAKWQADRVPQIAPLIDGYEVAGWSLPAGEIGGNFHDWSVLNDGRLSVIVGEATGQPLEALLGAATLQAAVKAHAAHRHSPAKLLMRVNDSIMAASPGNEQASLAYALLNPTDGELEMALAGGTAVIIAGAEQRMITTTDAPPIGMAAGAVFEMDRGILQPGEALVFMTSGVSQAIDPTGLRIGEPAIASLVANHLRESAVTILKRLRRLLEHSGQIAADMTVLVVKRRI